MNCVALYEVWDGWSWFKQHTDEEGGGDRGGMDLLNAAWGGQSCAADRVHDLILHTHHKESFGSISELSWRVSFLLKHTQNIYS